MKPPCPPAPTPMLGIRQGDRKADAEAEVTASMPGCGGRMVRVPGDKREQTAAPPQPGLGQGHAWPMSWEAAEPGGWAQEAQLSAESEWDRRSEAWINLGACLLGLGAGEGGVYGPLLFLCHCCGKGHRQDTGEPGPVGSLLPDSIDVCVRVYGAG